MLHQSGKKPQRGFGGRLIFYGEDAEKPVLVDGQLVVYAFDETNREPTDNKPTRRYVFPPDQVARRMSKSALGSVVQFLAAVGRSRRPANGNQPRSRGSSRTAGAIVVGEQTQAPAAGRDGSPMRDRADATATETAGRHSDAAGDADSWRRSPHRRRPWLASQVQLASYEAPSTLPAAATWAALSRPQRSRNGG